MKTINHRTEDYSVRISEEGRRLFAMELTLPEALKWHAEATGDEQYFAAGKILRAQALESRHG
jgi:hypothetical protein